MWQNQTKLQIHVCGYWSRFFNFFYKVQSHHRATCRVSGLLYTPPPRKLSRAFYFSRISCVAVATPKSLKREPFTRRWSLVEQIKKIIQFCFDFLWTGKFVLFIAFVIIKIPEINRGFSLLVRWRGLEPPRLTAHAPQACLSANSSTSARTGRIIIGLLCLSSKFIEEK